MISDTELLRSNNEKNFRILFDRYWKELYQKALPRLNGRSDAEEIVQDIFISLWNNRQTVTVEVSLKPYLFTALKYAIIKKVSRDYKKNKTHPLNVETIRHIFLSNEDLTHYRQLQKALDLELGQLPDRMQQIYRMSRNDDLRISEIAEQLQLSEQTVKNILSDALKRLRTKLVDYKFVIFML